MNVVKDVIDKIEREKGIVRPRDVLEVARDEDSPIHSLFEWDNTRAGEMYRLSQAGQLIVSVKVTIDDRVVNAFQSVNVSIDNKNVSGYVSIATISQNEDMRIQVLTRAIKEIKYWEKQYKDVEELKGVVNTKKVNKILIKTKG